MTTPDKIQSNSSFDEVLRRADELALRYGEACERRDAARNPLARLVTGVTVAVRAVDLRTTEQFAVEELQKQQIADGAVPMVED